MDGWIFILVFAWALGTTFALVVIKPERDRYRELWRKECKESKKYFDRWLAAACQRNELVDALGRIASSKRDPIGIADEAIRRAHRSES